MSAKSGDTAPCRRLRINAAETAADLEGRLEDSVAGETRRARLEIGDFPFAPRSSPPRPSPGSRRCPAAGQRAPWRGPRLGRHASPTSAGLVQPAAIWASVWVRAFLAYGISRSIAHRSTLSAGHDL